jgi:hypothetical protein
MLNLRTIEPSWSTMQMLLVSSKTSASQVIGCLPRSRAIQGLR